MIYLCSNVWHDQTKRKLKLFPNMKLTLVLMNTLSASIRLEIELFYRKYFSESSCMHMLNQQVIFGCKMIVFVHIHYARLIYELLELRIWTHAKDSLKRPGAPCKCIIMIIWVIWEVVSVIPVFLLGEIRTPHKEASRQKVKKWQALLFKISIL